MLYHGTHTSLYKSLPPSVIPILEDAILKTRVRLYEAAEKVFTTELSSYSHVPIVALEHAELSLHRYKFFRVLEVLDKVPEDAFTDSEEDRQVQQLFAIFRAAVRNQTEGVYEEAMQELRTLQQTWASKPVGDYTDIEVESVRKYSLVSIYLASASSFITEESKLIPLPNPSATPPIAWQGLTDLRVSLISQGRFMEAIRFFSVERSKATAIEQYQLGLLLLKLAMDHRAKVINTEDALPWSAAMLQLKLDLGGLFADLGAKTEAEVWLVSIEKDLKEIINKMNGENGSLEVSDSLCTMTIEYYRLKVVEKEEPTKAQFQQVLELSERMMAVGHFKADSCYDLALAWAKKLYSGEECDTICTKIQFRNQTLLENVQGRIAAALTNLMDIVRPRATFINEATKNIEIIEAFIGRHPSVGLPTALPGIRRQLGILNVLYSHVGGRLLTADTDTQEARELQSALPTGLNFRRLESNSEVDEDTLKVKHILNRQTVKDVEFDMNYSWFSEAAEVRARKLLRQLLDEDSRSGILTEDEIGKMFEVQGGKSGGVREYLLGRTDWKLLEELVGNLDHPIREAQWTKRRPFLKAWLLDASRSRLLLRQCLWIDLHNLRAQVWSSRCIGSRFHQEFSNNHEIKPENIVSLRKSWALGLAEETRENIQAIEDRIELEEVKLINSNKHYERETFIAEGSIPHLCVQIFFCSVVPNQEPGELCMASLDHAEEVARRQLSHWRSVENYQMIAQSAMMIANIAQYRIESRIIKEATIINRTLEEALELLEETESLFGTTLYEADFGPSLAALEMKVHLGSKMNIWTVGSTAVRLLFHAIQMINDKNNNSNSDASSASQEEKVMRLWQWVQRVKARGLAQSMGLDNMVPDVILAGIQDSINEERANAKSALATSIRENRQGDEAEITKALESIRLEEVSAPPLNLLPAVRRILKESKVVISEGKATPTDAYPPEMSSKIILEGILSMMRDLNTVKTIEEKLKGKTGAGNEMKGTARKELSEAKARIAMRPAFAKLVTIADLLNREETLVNEIDVDLTADRYQRRIELQRLRKEMREEPVLQRLLRIREGWPLSPDDLLKVAAGRNGKVVFVDWFRVTSSFNQIDKIYMIIWRNGVCKLIDLNTEFKKPWQEIVKFWKDKDVYLPDIDRTKLDEMDWERFIPKSVNVEEDDVQPVENCIDLVRPLFDDPLIEEEDLLILSVTEGFHNFPLHAIEDYEKGPLILHHPVVYIPSLSVLHKCFWTRYASHKTPTAPNTKLQALILGGVDNRDEAYYYGGRAVDKIGQILNTPQTTFKGPAATLANFNTHISNSSLLHIHLHTNYGTTEADTRQPPRPGLLSSSTPEDLIFTTSPLNQAIVFNSAPTPSLSPSPSPTSNQLSARQILALKLSRGTHLNLVGCASGQQGKFNVPKPQMRHNSTTTSATSNPTPNPTSTPATPAPPNTTVAAAAAATAAAFYSKIITDEVMGLVPAFLFAGAGSVTSTLWPILDEHGAVFSCLLFGELVRASGEGTGTGTGLGQGHGTGQEEGKGTGTGKGKGKMGEGKGKGGGKEEKGLGGGWVDLADVHRAAVLEMRSIYKQPSAWAGFVLSGYWNFRAG